MRQENICHHTSPFMRIDRESLLAEWLTGEVDGWNGIDRLQVVKIWKFREKGV